MSLQISPPPNTFWLSTFYGGLAALVAKTISGPIERVKLLLQTQDTIRQLRAAGAKYRGALDCCARLVREEGVLSLWRGNLMNIVRYVPNQAFNFGFNQLYQKNFCTYDPVSERRKYLLAYFLSGGFAGVTAATLFYPLDFVRTRLGTDLGPTNSHKREFSGIADCVRKIHAAEGLPGFYRGLSVSLYVVFVYRGIYFGGSEIGKRELPAVRNNRAVKFVFYQGLTLVAGALCHPFDTVRRRLMMQAGRPTAQKDYRGVVDCMARMYREEGLGGFMKGGLTNMVRCVSSSLVLVLFDELVEAKKKF